MHFPWLDEEEYDPPLEVGVACSNRKCGKMNHVRRIRVTCASQTAYCNGCGCRMSGVVSGS